MRRIAPLVLAHVVGGGVIVLAGALIDVGIYLGRSGR